MQCPSCGNEVTEGSNFCNVCGQRMPVTVVSSQTPPPGELGDAPDWYRALLGPEGRPNLGKPAPGVRRIEFGIAGRQPKKWVAELVPSQRVRIAFAEGAIQYRAPRPWEKASSLPHRRPWTTEKEGALLLVVENRAYRYADIRDQWVTTWERAQVYVGIEDTRHKDNRGDYGGIIEIASAEESAE